MEQIGPYLEPGAILSDVGSVKAYVTRQMAPHTPKGVHLIPGHPIAGTEHSGPSAGFPELFINRWCVLTPEASVDTAAVSKLSAFWTALGLFFSLQNAVAYASRGQEVRVVPTLVFELTQLC